MHPWILAQVPGPSTTGPAVSAPANTTTGTPAPATQVEQHTATSQPGSQPASQPAPDGSSWFSPIMILPLGVLAFYLMTRGKGKEEKKRKAQLDAMKKGDEVETIGGLVGKIVDVKDNKVVIKIDESANVKATYLKAAISRVITQEDKDKADEKK